MISVILALIFFTHCIHIFLVMETKDIMEAMEVTLINIEKQGNFDDEPTLSSYEEERMDVNNEFDERIRQMADELNYGAQYLAKHVPTESEVLEDGLYNIPHNDVNLYQMDSEETSQ